MHLKSVKWVYTSYIYFHDHLSFLPLWLGPPWWSPAIHFQQVLNFFFPDINECDSGVCDDECEDTIGSYTCSCGTGFTLFTEDGTAGVTIPPGSTGRYVNDDPKIDHTCVREYEMSTLGGWGRRSWAIHHYQVWYWFKGCCIEPLPESTLCIGISGHCSGWLGLGVVRLPRSFHM